MILGSKVSHVSTSPNVGASFNTTQNSFKVKKKSLKNANNKTPTTIIMIALVSIMERKDIN